MDDKRLEEIEARCNAATPGPWHVSLCEWECECCGEKLNNCDKEPGTCGEGRVLTGAFVTETKTTDWGDYCDMNDTDAEFIAHSREDIPYLLSRVRAAEKRAEAAENRLRNICQNCPGLGLMVSHGID